MSKKHDSYFAPIDESETAVKTEKEINPESFFTAIDDNEPLSTPDTINTETITKPSEEYHFVEESIPTPKTARRLFFVIVGLFSVILGWQAYSILMELFNTSAILGSIFGVLILVLLELIVRESYNLRKGQLQFAKVERLRDMAETFLKEHSQGKSSKFVTELSNLYKDKPQHPYLAKVIENQADYLNDAEVVTDLSHNFLSQLDKEALRIIKSESLSAATMISVSQVAIIDSLIVIWKNIRMVNQINNIYGLSLTRLGQWQLFMRIVKSTLLAAGSQKGINLATDNIASLTQVPGAKIFSTVTMSLLQGLGVGTYVAKIGVEAMKQNRPIPFEEEDEPKINLIAEGIKYSLGIDQSEKE